MKHYNKNQHGFTLTELLVVIIIIGITATMAMPKMKKMSSSFGMDAARRMVLSVVNAASRTAKTRNRDVFLVFNFSQEKIYIYVDINNNGVFTDDGGHTLMKKMPEGINLAGLTNNTTDSIAIPFKSYGTVDPSNGTSIHFAPNGVTYVTGNKTQYETVVVSNMTQKPRYYNFGKNSPFP